ncbi:hypothetical protein ACQKNC_21855 [Lysinibacillus sp. NPDC094177]
MKNFLDTPLLFNNYILGSTAPAVVVSNATTSQDFFAKKISDHPFNY